MIEENFIDKRFGYTAKRFAPIATGFDNTQALGLTHEEFVPINDYIGIMAQTGNRFLHASAPMVMYNYTPIAVKSYVFDSIETVWSVFSTLAHDESRVMIFLSLTKDCTFDPDNLTNTVTYRLRYETAERAD